MQIVPDRQNLLRSQTMASFVHTETPESHPGVARFEAALASAGQIRRNFDGSRSLATLMLAAMVSALVVVADQLIDTWADGHLLTAWIALWLVGFCALALLADTAKQMSKRVMARLNAWSHRIAKGRADARLMVLARQDPRIMAEIGAAQSRATQLGE
jgi:hypothetical protein